MLRRGTSGEPDKEGRCYFFNRWNPYSNELRQTIRLSKYSSLIFDVDSWSKTSRGWVTRHWEPPASVSSVCLTSLLPIRLSLDISTALFWKAWGKLSALQIAVHSWFIKMCKESLYFLLRWHWGPLISADSHWQDLEVSVGIRKDKTLGQIAVWYLASFNWNNRSLFKFMDY